MTFIAPPDAPDEIKAYPFKTNPYAHQYNGLLKTYRMPAFAIFWEPRVGKTKISVDTAALAFLRKSITGMGVVAPKGVDKNWEEEIQTHMPDEVPRQFLLYRANDAGTVWWKNAFKDLLAYDGLAIFAINVDSCARPNGRAALQKFMEARRTFLAFDESADGKTPNSARTKALYHLSKRAKARRILDGTPAAESPLELFAQYRFLSPDITGYSNFTAFKSRYAVYEDDFIRDKDGSVRKRPKLVNYAHLDELMAKVAPYTDRVRRDDVFDMPAKVYQKERYQLSEEQARVYNDLHTRYRTELKSGATITAANVLVRYLRLQQVLSNRFPSERYVLCTACSGAGCSVCDEAGVIENSNRDDGHIIDPLRNPRIEALNKIISTSRARTQPTIVWCRFRGEAADAVALARQHGRRVARYDGSCSDDEKFAAKRGFQAGDLDFLVGSAPAGGRGITLSKCQLMVYLSNYFALRLRLQSEDRGEAPGKKEGTDIVDLIAEGTIDEDLITALRGKKVLSDMINGDPQRAWL